MKELVSFPMLSFCKKHGLFTALTDECPKCAEEDQNARAQDWFGAAGQDLARYRDFSGYVSLRIQDGRARIKRLFMWPHVNYEVVMRDTMRFLRLDRVRVFDVDTTNDSKVGEDYKGMGAPIEPVRFTAVEKQLMVEYYRDIGHKGLLTLPTKGPFVDQLRRELSEQERIQGASETPKFGHPEGTHDDFFWSLMLAVRAAAPWLTAGRFGYMAKFERPLAKMESV